MVDGGCLQEAADMAAGADAEGSHLKVQARSKASEWRMVNSFETWKPRFGVAGEKVSG